MYFDESMRRNLLSFDFLLIEIDDIYTCKVGAGKQDCRILFFLVAFDSQHSGYIGIYNYLLSAALTILVLMGLRFDPTSKDFSPTAM